MAWRCEVKAIVRNWIPPAIYCGLNKAKKYLNPPPPPSLFDGDSGLFEEAIDGCEHYAEYGCGSSTKWVMENTSCETLSVDSSSEWIDFVRAEYPNETRLQMIHVDIGELVDWGKPRDYSMRHCFRQYRDAVWDHVSSDFRPTTLLIDGRMRVACFLKSLRELGEGAKIVFDDYVHRPRYHVVEEFLKPDKISRRQALFIVPNRDSIDIPKLESEYGKFAYEIY